MTKFLRRTWAEIDVDALIHNFNIIKQTANTKVCAVIKANAYGHGVDIVAPLLQQAGADFFAVSNIEEALELRELGITKPILILGYTPVEYVQELATHEISQCVYSLDYANELSVEAAKYNVKIKVHLKLDTGMSRIGFDCRCDEIVGIGDAISAAKLDRFDIEGVFTHFAVSDRNEHQEDGFTAEQYNRFCKAIDALKA
ncbi:MAG: alanine racemase, partial [Clostridia bacterium]|nr:alanine racemase [Clostridia bacterium]